VAKLSLSRAWDETKSVLSRDGKLIGAVGLALVVFPQALAGLFSPQEGQEMASGTMWVLTFSIIVAILAQTALNRLAIGPSTTVGDAIRRAFRRTPALLAAFILLGLVLVVVLIILFTILAAAGVMSVPTPGQPPSPGLVGLLLVIAGMGYAVFQLMIPVAAVEDGGPLRIARRSWTLSRGNYLRLLLFVVALLISTMIVWMAGQFVFGSLVSLLLGAPTPFSLSALVLALLISLIQAGFTIIFAVMLARIYVQLSAPGHAGVSVPSSGT
jgi:hypothetical protein